MHAIFALSLVALTATAADVEELIFQLRSPDQKIRDTAAAELRKAYVPTTRERWEPLVSSIKPGASKSALLKLLQPTKSEGGEGTGQSHMETYPLDDCWVVRCWFNNADDTMRSIELVERMRTIWVKPPEKFTGSWTSYYVNGQKCNEIQYKDGKYNGTFLWHHSNGARGYVQQYIDHVVDGEDVGYYPSGRLMYRGTYHKGKQVGTWTHYAEDGSVRSTEKFADGK